ncbi:MAG TPA: alpha amylase C-terminal domain-containing protein [Bacteroidales bacterium]|nr:alpha amylase C-terminal domain-containing protein [Bacteroidales bacterium]
MKLIDNDSWLNPYKNVLEYRQKYLNNKEKELTADHHSIYEFAKGHHYFGIHRNQHDYTWIIREWIPNATQVYLIGDFNQWQPKEGYAFSKKENGNWELILADDKLKHGDHYKLRISWKEGSGDRIPAWATRCIQNPYTNLYNAQVWCPDNPYVWKNDAPSLSNSNPLIYESHVGMATEKEDVGSFDEFRLGVLPRIIKNGYNTIQLMAIQEHPYYGSFGYHVSNLFAVSSRFGTPEELKALIDEAHKQGVAVIMDIVHSHGIKNTLEGLGMYAGDPGQFFHTGHRREHTAWDSLCYDYGKNEVLHFLLSNISFWMEEYRFDGFRFDGITSMLYYDHGLGKAFTSYNQYFDGSQDIDALTYLALANKLIKSHKPDAISIAEDMSGYPGLASNTDDGGMGFTHRLAMGIPDYWIKTIKEQLDENWNMPELFHELTSRRQEEKVISYTESHDQALVGDKTLIFRLIDKEMYWHMDKNSQHLVVDRGIALHKMIRLVTIATASGGYLNFMGNEFGHPEWIDFPREGNSWSYKYARRQWSLADNKSLKYHYLLDFDRAFISFISGSNCMDHHCVPVKLDNHDNIISFTRGEYLFVFNFHPTESYTGYGIPTDKGKYRILLCSDDTKYGGFGRVDTKQVYRTHIERSYGLKQKLDLYLPNRTAIVLEKQHIPKVR